MIKQVINKYKSQGRSEANLFNLDFQPNPTPCIPIEGAPPSQPDPRINSKSIFQSNPDEMSHKEIVEQREREHRDEINRGLSKPIFERFSNHIGLVWLIEGSDDEK